MVEKIPVKLTGVPETLLIPLNIRARQTLLPNGYIKDPAAVSILEKLDVDMRRLQMRGHDEVTIIARMLKYDEHARAFLARNPGAVVVHIGCGLDTRFERVDDGLVEWFDLDLPEVIRLRQQIIPQDNPRHHSLAESVLEEGWMEKIHTYLPRPMLFISEGVLTYFLAEDVRALVLRLQRRFPGSELVCDIHTPFIIWADNMHLAIAGVKARMHWGMKDAREMETWADGIQLLDAWNYFEDEGKVMRNYRWMRYVPGFAKAAGVYRFRLGG